MKRFALALLVTLSVLVIAPTAAHACSCVNDSVAGHVARADLVVRGTIESRDEPGNPLRIVRSSGDEVVYRVGVDRVYKGRWGPAVEIHSVVSGASCGLEVDVGKEYLVYAAYGQGASQDELWASLCGGTMSLDDSAPAELTDLFRRGEPPDRSIPTPEDGPPTPAYLAGGVAAAGLTVLMVALWRRREAADREL